MTAVARPTAESTDRGVKRRCSECDAPFYDMLRYPIRCPKCGAEHDAKAGKKKLASVPRPPRSRTSRGGKTAPKFEKQPAPEQAEVEAAPSDDERDDENDGDDEKDDETDAEAVGDDNETDDR